MSRSDLVKLVLAAACWGLGTVVSKRALAELPPITLLATQLAISVLVLAVLIRRVPDRGSTPRGLARLGLLNPGLAYALSLLGLVTISASLSVVLWALEPLLIVVLATIVLGERLTPALIGLTVVALVGMIIVAWDPAVNGALGGVLLTIAGIICCAIYSVATRRWLPGADSTADVVLAQQAHALALALVGVMLAAWWGGAAIPASLSPTAVASAVVSGLLYYAAAYWFYLGALRNVPASRAVVSFYLIPIFGVVASFAWLGERMEPRQLAGAAIVVAAVILSARAGDPAASAAHEGAGRSENALGA